MAERNLLAVSMNRPGGRGLDHGAQQRRRLEFAADLGLVAANIQTADNHPAGRHPGQDFPIGFKLLALGGQRLAIQEQELGPQHAYAFGSSRQGRADFPEAANVGRHLDPEAIHGHGGEAARGSQLLLGALLLGLASRLGHNSQHVLRIQPGPGTFPPLTGPPDPRPVRRKDHRSGCCL